MCNGEQLLCCVCRLLNGTSHLDPFRKAMMEFLSVRIIDGSAQKCISFEKWGEFIEIQFGSRGSTPGVKNESVVIRRCQMTQKTLCDVMCRREQRREQSRREQRRYVSKRTKARSCVLSKVNRLRSWKDHTHSPERHFFFQVRNNNRHKSNQNRQTRSKSCCKNRTYYNLSLILTNKLSIFF